MSFRILGLSPEPFRPLFALSDKALHRQGARRFVADDPRMPCRVSMAHADVGEEVLLLNFEQAQGRIRQGIEGQQFEAGLVGYRLAGRMLGAKLGEQRFPWPGDPCLLVYRAGNGGVRKQLFDQRMDRIDFSIARKRGDLSMLVF